MHPALQKDAPQQHQQHPGLQCLVLSNQLSLWRLSLVPPFLRRLPDNQDLPKETPLPLRPPPNSQFSPSTCPVGSSFRAGSTFGHFCPRRNRRELASGMGLGALASWKGPLSRGRAAHGGWEETSKINSAPRQLNSGLVWARRTGQEWGLAASP